jgi:hypothetical protein
MLLRTISVDVWSAFMHSAVLKKIHKITRLLTRHQEDPVKVKEMAEAWR